MKLYLAVSIMLLSTLVICAQQAMPRMTTVEPGNGKVGDVLVITGENLDKAQVSEIYLTDGKNDLKVDVTEQSATLVKFKVPAKAKPGRFSLMLLTTGKEPKLIEQPVRVTIE